MMPPSAQDYDRRANVHRPVSLDAMAAEIRRLQNTGLTVRDISVALRVDMAEVLQAITDSLSTGDPRYGQTHSHQ